MMIPFRGGVCVCARARRGVDLSNLKRRKYCMEAWCIVFFLSSRSPKA